MSVKNYGVVPRALVRLRVKSSEKWTVWSPNERDRMDTWLSDTWQLLERDPRAKHSADIVFGQRTRRTLQALQVGTVAVSHGTRGAGHRCLLHTSTRVKHAENRSLRTLTMYTSVRRWIYGLATNNLCAKRYKITDKRRAVTPCAVNL